MSLREKAREVKAAGEAERGNFTPPAAPLRLYKYWARHSKNAPERENFCHFWRVVVFWAPFMSFRRAAAAVFSSPITLGILGLFLLVALFFTGLTFHVFGEVVLFCLAFIYTATGLVCGGIYADEKYKHDSWKPTFNYEQEEPELFRPRIEPGLRTAAWITGLVSWFTFGLVSIGSRIDKSTRETMTVFIAWALGILLVGFVGIAYFSSTGWFGLVYIAVTLATIALIVGFGVGLGAFAQAQRRRTKDRAAKRPAPVKSEEALPVTPRAPGRVSKFFTAVADFLILAVQVVRVNKWKICPIVNIDEAVDSK